MVVLLLLRNQTSAQTNCLCSAYIPAVKWPLAVCIPAFWLPQLLWQRIILSQGGASHGSCVYLFSHHSASVDGQTYGTAVHKVLKVEAHWDNKKSVSCTSLSVKPIDEAI